MKRLRGFSLMEMMIVLAIVAVVAAASAPMVNKKMVRVASEKSPWIFVNGESIGYNIDNGGGIQDRKTATIGTNGRVPSDAGNPRLYIDTNSDATPHILFGRQRTNLMRLIAGGQKNSVWLSSADTNNNIGSNSVTVGPDARATDNNSIAIGNNAQATFVDAIAIGGDSLSDTDYSIAIGSNSKATDIAGVAIGYQASASTSSIGINGSANGSTSIALLGTTANVASNSIAIGQEAEAIKNDTIAIGRGANANPGAANVKARSIAIGLESQATNSDAIAIGTRFAGRRTTASGIGSTALGSTSRATANFAIAIGGSTDTSAQADGNSNVPTTQATAEAAIAIGAEAQATAANSVAIGRGAIANRPNTIVLGGPNSTLVLSGNIQLGNATSTIYIPGNLVVDRNVYLNRSWNGANNVRTYLGIYRKNSSSDGKGLTALSYRKVYDRKGVVQHDTDIRTWEVPLPSCFTSDRRLKNIGKEFTSGLDKIKKLELYNYTFKDNKDKTPRVGVMAQDLQKIFPDAVVKGEDGFFRIRMEDMFYAVINAVKELDNRTSAQEQKIKELEKQNIELIKQNTKILKRIEALEKRK